MVPAVLVGLVVIWWSLALAVTIHNAVKGAFSDAQKEKSSDS